MRLTVVKTDLYAALCILSLIALPLLALWPGLTGPFLLDDIPNLWSLGHFGGVTNLETLLQFVFGNNSGPTGRPLAMATFLLDAQMWPAEPAPFKYTNVLFHVLNGLLLFALILRLSRVWQWEVSRGLMLATLTSLLWLLHPIQPATALYVIQRMAELAAAFSLLGLLCYVIGREQLQEKPLAAYLWMSAGAGLCTLLATLSKENGALLPLLILIFEFTLLRGLGRPRQWRYWAIPFLFLPVAIILAYLLSMLPQAYEGYGYGSRNFTMFERLMTEGRILVGQLTDTVLPPMRTPSLFHDGITVSSSLFSPFTTLLAVIAIIALLVSAYKLRRQLPVYSFAIFWFFGGHLLESTFIGLELYFEHRNYIPMMGPIFALAYYLVRLLEHYKKVIIPVAALLLTFSFSVLYANSKLWGDNFSLVEAWAKEYPYSIRAQQLYAHNLTLDGRFEEASAHLAQARRQGYEGHLGSKIHLDDLLCLQGKLSRDELKDMFRLAAEAPYDTETLGSVVRLRDHIRDGYCRHVTAAGLHGLIDTLDQNPNLARKPSLLANLRYVDAELYAQERRLKPAIQSLEKAHEHLPRLQFSLRQAELLTSAGQYKVAKGFLDRAYQLDAQRTPPTPSRAKELDRLREFIDNRLYTPWLPPPQNVGG